MPSIGFSTGALFKEALAEGVAAAEQMNLDVIELSALRFRELTSLVEFVATHSLAHFTYVSVHAPTDYAPDQEGDIAAALLRVASKWHWPIIVHPDCLSNFNLWKPFGALLCIENMDKRKTVGRTVEELTTVFEQLPEAKLCFDVAHARQIDSSMTEAYRILRTFSGRICQVHLSEVTSSSKHERISDAAVEAYREVAWQWPHSAPVIWETPVRPEEARGEIEQANRVFQPAAVLK